AQRHAHAEAVVRAAEAVVPAEVEAVEGRVEERLLLPAVAGVAEEVVGAEGEGGEVVLGGDVEGDAGLVVPVAEAHGRVDEREERGEVGAPAGDDDVADALRQLGG